MSKRSIPILVLSLTAAVAVAAPRAHADSGAVLVLGSAGANERTTVASAVRSAARGGGWELVETPFSDLEVSQLAGCVKSAELWSCVSPVIAPKGIARLILVRVDTSGKPKSLVLTQQVLLSGSKVSTSDQRACDTCTDETLTRVSFDLTTALIKEASAGTAKTKITIRSTPPGAWITFDNASVGVTNRTYSTFPGHHTVMVQLDGFAPQTQEVDVREDEDTVVAFDLRQTTDGGGGRSPYLFPSVVAGVGALALGGGIALQVSTDPPTSGKQPAKLYSYPGIGLMAAGSAVIAVSVYMFVRRSKASRTTSAPTAALADGGGTVGWFVSF